MLRVLIFATFVSVAAARLLHKSQAKMRVATRLLPVQIPLQIPLLVPMGTPLDQAGPFPQGPFAQFPMMPSSPFMMSTNAGPELDEMEISPMNMGAPFGGFVSAPGLQPQAVELRPEDVEQLRQLQ